MNRFALALWQPFMSLYSIFELFLGRVGFICDPLYFHLKYGCNPGGDKSIQKKYFESDMDFVEHGYNVPDIVCKTRENYLGGMS